MKRIVYFLFLFLLVSMQAHSQESLKWDWVIMNNACPSQVPSSSASIDGDYGPKHIQVDGQGNVYTLGYIATSESYLLATNTNGIQTVPLNNPTPNALAGGLYLTKVDSSGQMQWYKNLVYSGNSDNALTHLFVNSQNGEVYLYMSAVQNIGVYINGSQLLPEPQTQDLILTFDPQGILIDTLWETSVTGVQLANDGNLLITKSGPYYNGGYTRDYMRYGSGNYTWLANSSYNEPTYQTIHPYTIPSTLLYNNYTGTYMSFSGNNVAEYNTSLAPAGTHAVGGVSWLHLKERELITKQGSIILSEYNSANYTTTLYCIGSDYQLKWQKPMLYMYPFSMECDTTGNTWIFFTRYQYPWLYDGLTFSEIIPMMPGTLNFPLAVKLDSETGTLTGDYLKATHIAYALGGKGFVIDGNNRFYMTGGFRYEAEFGTETISWYCQNSNTMAINHFIARASQGTDTTRFNMGIGESELENIVLYPNPTADYVYIKNESMWTVESLTIRDLRGSPMATLSANAYAITNGLDLSHLSAGIYVMEIEIGGKKIRRKIIKQ